MKFKNSSIYIQRQIDCLLHLCYKFTQVYVNDIVIFFKILKKHLHYLSIIFILFVKKNIFIKFSKIFLEYLII